MDNVTLVGLALGVVGVAASVIGWPWLKLPLEYAWRRCRIAWIVLRSLPLNRHAFELAKTRAIQKDAMLTQGDRFIVSCWDLGISVNSDGDASCTILIELKNRSDDLQPEIFIPLYFEPRPDSPDVRLYVGGVERPALLSMQWDGVTGTCSLRVRFPRPLRSRESLRFELRYEAKSVFKPGAEWWEWYFRYPQLAFTLRMRFDESWRVERLDWRRLPDGNRNEEPQHLEQIIRWDISGPEAGTKYRLEFDLTKLAG